MFYLVFILGCRWTPNTLNRPNAIALDGEQIYVSDFHHQRVVVFDALGGQHYSFGSMGLGKGELWEVWDLDVMAPGVVAVLNNRPTSATDDEPMREIKIFKGGREISQVTLTMPEGQRLGWSDGFVTGPDGTWLLAVPSEDAILEFAESGEFIRTIWGAGTAVELNSPSSIIVDGTGVWVTEQFRHQLRRIEGDTVTHSLGEEGVGHGQLRFPKATQVCADWVVVADFGNYRIARFDRQSGEALEPIELTGVHTDTPAQLMDVEVSEDCQQIYVVDSKGNRVVVVSPDGSTIQELVRW